MRHETLAPEVQGALEQCRGMITKGSKSFSLAARLFDAETRDAAFFLYGWCRFCDDQIDAASQSASQAELEQRLKELKEKTASAFSPKTQKEPIFVALQYIVKRYAIPGHYALELIEGMAMDVRGTRYPTFNDLLVYCYRVAGTVGLMMSHVMGLRDEQALRHAADLGIAMQLTNIARDITQDAAMGRIYIPLDWLNDAQIDCESIAAPAHRETLAALTIRLLHRADQFYASGDRGLWYLSFRSALAVAAARHVYAEIATLLKKRGARAWDQRGYVTGGRKLWVVLRGMTQVCGSLPSRILRPWAPAPIRTIWKHSTSLSSASSNGR